MNWLNQLFLGRRNRTGSVPPSPNAGTNQGASHVGWNFPEEGVGNAKLFLLDRTGSMGRGDAYRHMVVAVNAAIERDRSDPLARTAHTLVARFDSMGFDPIRNALMADVRPLTEQEFTPRALTPLYDAIGHAVDQVLEQPQRGRKILLVFTDGEENNSKKYVDLSLLRERIRLFEERGNIVVFMAANLDAQEAGKRFGIPPQRCINTRANGRPGTSTGLMACFLAAGALTTALLFASGAAQAASLGFTEDDRRASMGGVNDWQAAVEEDIASMDSSAESTFGLDPEVVRDLEQLPADFDPAGGSFDLPGSANFDLLSPDGDQTDTGRDLSGSEPERVVSEATSYRGHTDEGTRDYGGSSWRGADSSPPSSYSGGDSGGGGSDGGGGGGGGGE